MRELIGIARIGYIGHSAIYHAERKAGINKKRMK
jgi:hypothetical protein